MDAEHVAFGLEGPAELVGADGKRASDDNRLHRRISENFLDVAQSPETQTGAAQDSVTGGGSGV
jgi:hypothetical protein